MGDKEAFAYLYNLHVDSMYHYGTKLCQDEEMVKDAIQEVFLDLYLKKEQNKTNPDNLKFYLILALKRNLIRKLKRNRKLINKEVNDNMLFEAVYSVEKNIIAQEEDAEINKQVKRAIEKLSSKQREILYLRFNESMDYPEIAGLFNITIESARKQVYRSLKAIRESFGKDVFLFWTIVGR